MFFKLLLGPGLEKHSWPCGILHLNHHTPPQAAGVFFKLSGSGFRLCYHCVRSSHLHHHSMDLSFSQFKWLIFLVFSKICHLSMFAYGNSPWIPSLYFFPNTIFCLFARWTSHPSDLRLSYSSPKSFLFLALLYSFSLFLSLSHCSALLFDKCLRKRSSLSKEHIAVVALYRLIWAH